MWKELSVRLRTSLPSKWIQFQSCARCNTHTLKQASFPPHTPLPIAISFLPYCSHTSFCPYARFCASFLLPLELAVEQGSGGILATRDYDLQRAKKAFTAQPWLTGMAGWEEEDEEERHFYIRAPLITCWQDCGAGTAPSFSLRHDLAERGEVLFLQFPPPLLFLYYLFYQSYSSMIHFLPVFPPSFSPISPSTDPPPLCPRLSATLFFLRIILHIGKTVD